MTCVDMPCGTLAEAVYGCRHCHSLIPNCGHKTRGCCHCLPNTICVTFEVTETSSGDACTGCQCTRSFVKLTLTCDSDEAYYAGTLSCGNMSIDLKFTIELDEDDECVLCLTSSELSLTCDEGTSTGTGTGTGTGTAASGNFSGADKMDVP